MTAKEKAKEIVEAVIETQNARRVDGRVLSNEKRLALLVVESIVKALKVTTGHCTLNKLDQQEVGHDFQYWEYVKEEIEKL